MFKLDKALYGLKQEPRSWYDRLSKFLLEYHYVCGKIDNTLFVKRDEDSLLIVQVYIDDIIFRATNSELCQEFARLMSGEFEMSMIVELTFFLGLQIKQTALGTFIYRQKYIKELLKRYDMDMSKMIDTPIGTNSKLDLDEPGAPIGETFIVV